MNNEHLIAFKYVFELYSFWWLSMKTTCCLDFWDGELTGGGASLPDLQGGLHGLELFPWEPQHKHVLHRWDTQMTRSRKMICPAQCCIHKLIWRDCRIRCSDPGFCRSKNTMSCRAGFKRVQMDLSDTHTRSGLGPDDGQMSRAKSANAMTL